MSSSNDSRNFKGPVSCEKSGAQIQADVLDGNRRLFQDALFTDLVIKCSDRQFNVHRTICCPRSKVLLKMCTSGFKEGLTGEIVLDHDDVTAIMKMISYFYIFDFDETSPEESWMQGCKSMIKHASPEDKDTSMEQYDEKKTSTIADKSEQTTSDTPSTDDTADWETSIEEAPQAPQSETQSAAATLGRRRTAQNRPSFQERLASRKRLKRLKLRRGLVNVEPADPGAISKLLICTSAYALADKYDVPGLGELARYKFQRWLKDVNLEDAQFAHVISEVYTTTLNDRGLRAPLVALVARNFKDLKKAAWFNEALETIDGLPLDILYELQND